MYIKEVKTAFKIMDVYYDKGKDPSRLVFHYLENLVDENNQKLPQSILKKNVSRVYLIVVNDQIYKIGQSSDKSGIKSTLSIYKDGGVKGRPSVRSYGIFYFLLQEKKKGSKIEFYMIYQDHIKGAIKGLFKIYDNQNISISPKIIEERCLLDFREKENGKYPIWNLKEQAQDWPDLIKKIHSDIINISLTRTKK